MAEMVCSALVQEAVSRSLSFGFSRHEDKASRGHLVERLEMAVRELEFALERAQELPIRHLSLLQRKKMIKSAYVEAMELLDKHKQQLGPAGQELQVAQGVKRKRWFDCAKNMSLKPFVALSTDDVRRFEWYADHAGRFLRDMESGCSLHHNTFCNTIVRHLLERKTLRYYHSEQGNLVRDFHILPMYSDERGMEAVLRYHYGDNTTPIEKHFTLVLLLRLSESTDIVGVAIKGLQLLLTSGFKLAAEFAMGELTLLRNLQYIAHSYGPPWVGIQERHIRYTQCFRPDPACCKGSRHRLCSNNNVSSELSDIFPEQVICWGFRFYHIPALEPSRSSCRSFDVAGRSKSRGGGKPPLLLTATFLPHQAVETENSCPIETIGDVKEYRDGSSIQQVVEALKSNAANCFFRQPELTVYTIVWLSKQHGGALFTVEKASMERAGVPETRRRYNTRGSTRRSHRR